MTIREYLAYAGMSIAGTALAVCAIFYVVFVYNPGPFL